MRDSPALSFRSVRREYGEVTALASLDLDVPQGSCTVLVGRNGSGKTTTLQLAAGRLEPSAGVIKIQGTALDTDRGRARAREAVALAQDTPVFYPDLSVEEHLSFVATASGVHDHEDLAEDLLEAFSLRPRRAFLPDQLSAGMRQKLTLACALLRETDVLLLDEPSGALDPNSRAALWSRLTARKKAGAAIVFSSHHLDFPRDLVDRALVLQDGEVIEDGDYGEVVAGDTAAELGLT